MLSRMADALYWMTRYLERAGDTARLLDINLLYLLEAEDVISEAAQWKPLLSITSTEEVYQQLYADADISAARILQFMTQEPKNPNAIRSSLRASRENARVVRDRISKEMWQAMNDTWLNVDRMLARGPLSPDRAAAIYAEVRNGVARFHGLTVGTMMRGEAFGFYLLGLAVERADMTARILDVKYHLLLPDLSMVGSVLDYYQWAALLKSLSGFEAYRRRYQTGLRPIDVAAFVIFEPDFPRSLRFAVDRMIQAIDEVADEKGSESRKAARAVLDFLEANTPKSVFEMGLHEFLESYLDRVAELNAALASEFFEAYSATREIHD